MTLDILIPTYNREKDVSANLLLLVDYIRRLDAGNVARVIVSDNCSDDSTVEKIHDIIKSTSDVEIIFTQETSNKGLLHNLIKVLNYAAADYIMYLGDDDFISFSYFKNVMEILMSSQVSFILPSRGIVDSQRPIGSQLADLKVAKLDIINVTSFNRLLLASECNQLSGLVFRNNNLLRNWQQSHCVNLYPFMSFAGWCLATGSKAVKVVGGEVLVTTTNSKDWGYGSTGLLADIIDNVKNITRCRVERLFGELLFSFLWSDRVGVYLIRIERRSFLFLRDIFRDDRLLHITKINIVLIWVFLLLKFRIYKALGRLRSPH